MQFHREEEEERRWPQQQVEYEGKTEEGGMGGGGAGKKHLKQKTESFSLLISFCTESLTCDEQWRFT